jgi:hypothetical protein
MNPLKCHYCSEQIAAQDTECQQCGASLGKVTKSKPFLYFLLTIGACFTLYTIWVGYKLFF